MFSRIVKQSTKLFKLPLQAKSSFILPGKTCKFGVAPFYNNFTSVASFSSSQQGAYQSQVKSAITEFNGKENYTSMDVIRVLDSLEAAKAGINSSDPLFREFMMKLNDAVKNKFDAQSLEIIALKAYYLNIKDTLFWFSLDNTIKTSEGTMDFQTLLVLFSVLLRIKSYPHIYRYISAFKDDLLESTKQVLKDFDFRHVIHASNVFANLGAPIPELTKRLKCDLASSLKDPGSVYVSINDLATSAILISTLLKSNDPERVTLLRDLGKYLSTLNLLEFCASPARTSQTSIQDFEEEKLNWNSVAYLTRVFYNDAQIHNETLIKKLNEVIAFKLETDPIDFESGSIILSVLGQSKITSESLQKVLEAVYTQLAIEGATIFTQFDGRNVASLLRTLTNLAQDGKNKEIVEEFFEYFSGLIQSDKIATKIELEDYKLLNKIFTDAKRVTNVDDKVFTHIQNRIERIEEQRRKDANRH